MRTLTATLLIATLILAVCPAYASSPNAIDLAICLDTSGSMDGLIDAARTKLWAIVNDLALVDPTPTLRVALLSYGNDGHNAENGWVAVETDFTDDLDLVSERLFMLSTNGGTEYVGRVLNRAGGLDWNESDDALRIIVLAGNESADQDRVIPFRDVCGRLVARDIVVNAIYCGPDSDDVASGWREIAELSDGRYASIDQNRGTVVVNTPYDKQLVKLNTQLNETYIPLGAEGRSGRARRDNQDAISLEEPAVAAQRVQTKASAFYKKSWDLVDADESGEVKLEDIDTKDLPDSLQGKSAAEIRRYVNEMRQRRDNVRKHIARVGKQRDAYVVTEMKRRKLDDSQAFDRAVREAVRDQAQKKGFVFSDEGNKERAKTSADKRPSRPAESRVPDDAVEMEMMSNAPRQTVGLSSGSFAIPSAKFSDREHNLVRSIMERAFWSRPGSRPEDVREVSPGEWVVPDVVMAVRDRDDWRLLLELMSDERAGVKTWPYEMLIRVDGQTILINDGS